ncbi:MAG TPA: hypothetical protein DCS54_00970 [Oribacterium sp.]|nr:hypothetical protein [Oribacterium sp.]
MFRLFLISPKIYVCFEIIYRNLHSFVFCGKLYFFQYVYVFYTQRVDEYYSEMNIQNPNDEDYDLLYIPSIFFLNATVFYAPVNAVAGTW